MNIASVGQLEIIKANGAVTNAETWPQAAAASFTAYAGTVGKIIGAEHAAEQLIEIGDFIAGASGGVRLQLIGVRQILQMVSDKRLPIPTDEQALIALGIVAHGLRQLPLIFQKTIALLVELAYGFAAVKGFISLNVG